MTIADEARDSALHCEMVKYALRQNKDGVVVSFVVHPNDIPAALSTSHIGSRSWWRLVQIGDDERPIPPAAKENPLAQDERRSCICSEGTMTEQRSSTETAELPPDLVEAVTTELLAHGEFSSGMNNRTNAREAARVVIDMVLSSRPAQKAPWREAAFNAVSEILCGKTICTDPGDWLCPPDIDCANEMIAEIVAKVEALASPIDHAHRQPGWVDQNHQIDRYGVALMMIREGCADPAGLARRILGEFGPAVPSTDSGRP
jgi:hypothetical protein